MVAQVDHVLGQIENHEALSAAALREIESASARAHARLARVRKDGTALHQALSAAREAVGLWRERALRAGEDDSRALECLRRSKQAEHRAALLEQRAVEHDKAARELEKDVRALVERVSTLRDQHNVMRARQVRAEALASLHTSSESLGGELGAIFERWECQVAQSEFAGGCSFETEDGLDRELADEEELSSLRAELSSLRGARGGQHHE
jgi:phage shock protein A